MDTVFRSFKKISNHSKKLVYKADAFFGPLKICLAPEVLKKFLLNIFRLVYWMEKPDQEHFFKI